MPADSFKAYLSQFGEIDADALNELLGCFTPTLLSKFDFFTREDEVANIFGFLENGIVRAYVRNSEAKEFNKQFFVGPSIIGAYTSLLTKQPSKIIHEALTDCNLIVADYKKVTDLYDRHHSLERIGRKIAEFYYIEKERKLIEQAILDAEKRYLIFKENFSHIENDIPQYHIASYIGVTPTQLSRIRKKMSQSKISLHM